MAFSEYCYSSIAGLDLQKLIPIIGLCNLVDRLVLDLVVPDALDEVLDDVTRLAV